MLDAFIMALRYIFLVALLSVLFEAGHHYYRDKLFEQLQAGENKNQVISQLRSPFNVYNCKTGASPSSLPYSDSICEQNEKMLEVYAFDHCGICSFLDPGWFIIGFDAEGKMVEKYNIQSP